MSTRDIKLPELGEGVIEGELIRWLVAEGDSIQVDQALVEVMTDKASMEVPSPFDGVVKSLLVKEGEEVQVSQALLTIEVVISVSSDTQTKDDGSQTKGDDTQVVGEKELVSRDISVEKKSNFSNELVQDDVLATPFTRRLAREWDIDLNQLKGSGLAGRITKQDLLKHKKPEPSFSPVGFSVPREDHQEREALKGVRKKIADKMQMAKRVIPHFSLLESADMEDLDEIKNSIKELVKKKDVKVTYLSFVMRALLQTVKEFPTLNASIDDVSNEVVIKKYYHFGFATHTPRGLLVPVVKDVDKKSLLELSVEIQNLAEKAREASIKVDEMSGGTITITNIGSLGGQFATPIINPPEVAILGMYRLFIRSHWDGSAFVPRKTMNFSLTCDHRLIDGAVAAQILKSFVSKIEKPMSLFI